MGVLVVCWSAGIESWAHNPEETGSDPRAGGKFLSRKIVPPAHPPVKRLPGLVLVWGANYTGCASWTANGTGGNSCAHT